MPSSTFSFEPRAIPGGRWSAAWLVALVLAAAAVWQLERVTRAGGQRPSVVDDPLLWSLVRRRVDGDPRTVVLLGASRMALGYSPRAFADAAPGMRGVQLSIASHLPFAVLDDLAGDEQFRGVVVLDFIEPEITAPLGADAALHVQRARRLWRAPGALANRYLASRVQSHLAVLGVGGERIITQVFRRRRWPPPEWVAVARDRSSRGDYSLASPAALQSRAERRAAALPPVLPADAWLAALADHLEPAIRRIRARGGDVVVVHMPISGRLAASLDERYPRHRYWDVFAARTAAHTIHFRDLPAMAALACPDDVHLDQRDQAAFTRALVAEMRARGVFDARSFIESGAR